MSPEELAVVAAVTAAATPGPWEARRLDELQSVVLGDPEPGTGRGYLVASVSNGVHADAEFAAMARTAVPELLALVGRLHAYLMARGREAQRRSTGQRTALVEALEAMLRAKAESDKVWAAEGSSYYAGKAACALEVLEYLAAVTDATDAPVAPKEGAARAVST